MKKRYNGVAPLRMASRRRAVSRERHVMVGTASLTADEQHLADRICTIALHWFSKNGRVFPWRSTRDPYHILVAEVCLQKTNADKVASLFDRLIEHYPSVTDLAEAEEESLRRYFSGLGLLKRSKLLIEMAKTISKEHGGVIPRDREMLVEMKGIGEYTADGILCLAYGDRLPLLDRSTQRVLSRVFNRPTQKPAWADKGMREFMHSILPDENSREFNLALIDIAAYYCRPKKPKSRQCPLLRYCSYAKLEGE